MNINKLKLIAEAVEYINEVCKSTINPYLKKFESCTEYLGESEDYTVGVDGSCSKPVSILSNDKDLMYSLCIEEHDFEIDMDINNPIALIYKGTKYDTNLKTIPFILNTLLTEPIISNIEFINAKYIITIIPIYDNDLIRDMNYILKGDLNMQGLKLYRQLNNY